MVDKILKFLLLASPLIYALNIELDKVNIHFFILGVMGLFVASLFDIPKRKIDIKNPVLCLLGLGICNLFWNNFHPVVFSSFLNLFLAIFALKIIMDYMGKPSDYYPYIFYACMINVIIFLIQLAGFNPILNTTPKSEYGGLMGNAPRLMTLLTLSFPYINILTIGFIFGVIAIFTKEYVFLAVLAVILFLKSETKFMKILIGCISLSGLAIFHKAILNSILMRWNVWRPTIETVFKRPIFGYGLGSFPILSSQFTTSSRGGQVDYAFNSYLQFIFGIGLLGIPLLLWGGKYCLDNFKIDKESFGILALGILAFFEYPFEIPRVWFLIIFIIASFIITRKEIGKHESNLLGA